MISCDDPFVRAIRREKFSPVRNPSAAITPLCVLGGTGKRQLEHLGSLLVVAEGEGGKIEAVTSDAADLNIESSKKLGLTLGMNLLGPALASMGVSLGASLEAAYSSASKLRITLKDVRRCHVDRFVVGEYLSGATLKLDNVFSEFFTDEYLEAYIVTEVLQSACFSLEAFDKDDKRLGVDVDELAALGIEPVEVSSGMAESKSVVYRGTEPLTFAFKAFEVAYVDGEWCLRGLGSNSDKFLGDGDEQPAQFGRRNGFVEVRME